MSDRYQAGYYDHHQHSHSHHPHPYPHQTAMSHYPPQPYRSGYPGYHPYAGGYGYGSASSSYMPNYYRYAAYASPHYSQPHAHPHQGMFTPAGQQLIPSSVLHYPPRSHPQAHPYQHQPQQQQQQQQQQQSSYEQPPPSLYSSSASSSAYGQARGFGGYPGPTPHYAPPGRSTTPAPNRTVLPPNYLEPIRGYPEQHQLQHQHQHQQLPLSATPKLEESMPAELEVEAGSPAQRLTTSPPLISATGTDSGISNCSTRARSDSSQSTPVYSGEYPVNMSVESASCVPYHCPAEYEEEEQPQQQPPQQQPPQQQQQQQQSSVESEPELEERNVASVREAQTSSTPLDIPDDISATAAQSASPPTPPVASIDKATPTPTAAAVSEVPRRVEINLAKPNKETAAVAAAAAAGAEADTAAERATPTPQDAVERGSPCNPISEDAAEMPELGQQQEHPLPPATASNIWSTSPRRSRTPPVPQNSPVGYGQSASVPPGLAPLFQQQQKQSPSSHKRQTTAAKSRSISISNSNRIMECDLIPSKKSKRRTSKREAGGEEQLESMEPTVREQIRDIKPLPGFLQAFGSTEIGRFSERFLQTPESLVERLAEEYAASNSSFSPYTTGGYYEPPSTPPHSYHPYEEQQHAGYQGHMHMAHARNRGMRGHGGYGYEMPDYMAYERYAAYGAGRPRHRYGEIRCNGY